MKKILLLITTLISFYAYTCTPILEIEDEKNSYITIFADFSSGMDNEGINIVLVEDKPYNGTQDDYNGKLILFEGKTDKNGKIRIPKPKAKKYLVIFDEVDHYTDRKGPALTKEEMTMWKQALVDSKEKLGVWMEKMQGLVK